MSTSENVTEIIKHSTLQSKNRLIFVCKKCRQLTVQLFYPNNSENSQDDPSVKRTRTRALNECTSYCYTKNGYKDWVYLKDYEQKAEELKSLDFSHFPLCQTCLISATNRISKKIMLYSKEVNDCYELKNQWENNAKKNMETELETYKTVIVATNETIDQMENKMKELLENPPNRNLLKKKEDDVIVHCNDNKDVNRGPNHKCCSKFGMVTLCRAFRISTSRLYGTVNGNRIGNNTPNQVPVEEIDRGLYYLIHMIHAIGKTISRPVTEFILSSKIEFQVGKNTFIYSAAKLKSSKTIKQFNEGTKMLFYVCADIFRILISLNENFQTPNQIDLEHNCISNESFIYEQKNPHLFTIGVKRLLFNLKYIQNRAMDSFICNMNSQINEESESKISNQQNEENAKNTISKHSESIEPQMTMDQISSISNSNPFQVYCNQPKEQTDELIPEEEQKVENNQENNKENIEDQEKFNKENFLSDSLCNERINEECEQGYEEEEKANKESSLSESISHERINEEEDKTEEEDKC